MSESISNLKRDVMKRVYAIHVAMGAYTIFVKTAGIVGVLAIIAANVSFVDVWRNATMAGNAVRYIVDALIGARLILMVLGTSFVALCGSVVGDAVRLYKVRFGHYSTQV
jgi:hypothetical protein